MVQPRRTTPPDPLTTKVIPAVVVPSCFIPHHHHQGTRNRRPRSFSSTFSIPIITTTIIPTIYTTLPPSNPSNHNNNIVIMKAWTCHGRNQRDMVHQLQQAGIIRSPAVQQVMTIVDRKCYFPSTTSTTSTTTAKQQYYEDAPYPIGYGQTISAPHMHAYVLEEIVSHLSFVQQQRQQSPPSLGGTTATNHNRVGVQNSDSSSSSSSTSSSSVQFLDVGCGSGYITACFGRWLAPTTFTTTTNQSHQKIGSHSMNSPSSILGVTGYVYGMDIVPELVTLSRTNIQKQDGDLLLPPTISSSPIDTGNPSGDATSATTTSSPSPPQPQQPIVTLLQGNGYQGLPQYAPFDIIHVGAAARTFPVALCQQLKVGGLMIVPIHDNWKTNSMSSSSNTGNSSNNHDAWNPSNSQTLYKIERLDHPPSPDRTGRIDTTTTTTTTTVTSATNDRDVDTSDNGGAALSSSSSFNINEYRITPLLGVRYVPLVQEQ